MAICMERKVLLSQGLELPYSFLFLLYGRILSFLALRIGETSSHCVCSGLSLNKGLLAPKLLFARWLGGALLVLFIPIAFDRTVQFVHAGGRNANFPAAY